MLVDGLVGETGEVVLLLVKVEILSQDVLHVFGVDHPARYHLLFLLFLHYYVGGIDLFFLQFACLHFFNCFDCGLFLIAKLVSGILVDVDEISVGLLILFVLVLLALVLGGFLQ